MVAHDASIDQYFCAHPSSWLATSPEAAHAYPSNPLLLRQHALCAAAEHPLSVGDMAWFGPGEGLGDVVALLRRDGALIPAAAEAAGQTSGGSGGDSVTAPSSSPSYSSSSSSKSGTIRPGGGGEMLSFVPPRWAGSPSSRVSLRRMDDVVYSVIDG